MSALIGTMKVPGVISVAVSGVEVGTAEFEIEIDVEGGPVSAGRSAVGIRPPFASAKMRAAIASALRSTAAGIDADGNAPEPVAISEQ